MPKLRAIYTIIGIAIIVSGCAQKPTPKISKNTKKTVKKSEKMASKKQCTSYVNSMKHASNYIFNEFEKGYFVNNDFIGAKAQLFLVQSKSSTVFAQNINAAQDAYTRQYQLAKKKHCDTTAFKTTPLQIIQNKIERLSKMRKKTQ